MPFIKFASSSSSSSTSSSSQSTPTGGVATSPVRTNVFLPPSTSHPPRASPPFTLDLPANNRLGQQHNNTVGGLPMAATPQTPSPSSSCGSSAPASEFEGDDDPAGGGGGTLPRRSGGTAHSSAASSWQSLLGGHDKGWPHSRDGSVSGTEEATPKGERPPSYGNDRELEPAQAAADDSTAPSYFPQSYSFPPAQQPASAHPTLPFPHHTAPLTTSPPPPSSFRPAGSPTSHDPNHLHHPTPSISTTLSGDSATSTDSSSRSSVFSTASSRSSISSFGSSSSCSVSTPILPQPWPTADLSLGGADGEKVKDEEALVVETSDDSYLVVANLPGFSLDCITIATKQRRTLHIVADRWERESGAHFERKVTFGPDANLSKIRAQFDGNLLRVTVPRHLAPAASGSSTISKAYRSSAPVPLITPADAPPARVPSPRASLPVDLPSASEQRRTSLAGADALERMGLGTSREEIEREVERAKARDLVRF